MKKLVIKTVLITVAIVFALTALTFGAMSIFAPRSVAGFFDGVGGYSASVFFYEKEYVKTDDIDGLLFLIDKTCAKDDDERTVKYLEMLFDREDYNSFCEQKDKDLKQGQLKTDDYYKGLYALKK